MQSQNLGRIWLSHLGSGLGNRAIFLLPEQFRVILPAYAALFQLLVLGLAQVSVSGLWGGGAGARCLIWSATRANAWRIDGLEDRFGRVVARISKGPDCQIDQSWSR